LVVAKVLEGIRVIDLTTFMSGPFASMILGDLGAEVIKIEQPNEGDSSRHVPPYFHEGESLYYISLNRNKKSVTLNLTTEEGKEILSELVKKAGIVIDNFRPGILSKLGADYDRLKKINPQIISCSISAFGPSGPYGSRPAYDLTIQALSGAMSMTGEEGRGPLRLGVPMGDLAGSMWAVAAILAALHHKQKTGQGQQVDVSLLDSLIAFVTYPALYYSYGRELAKPLGSGHQAIVPFQAFKTKDYYLAVTCPRQKFWVLLCEALEVPELISDPRFLNMEGRLKNKEELNPILNSIFRKKTSAEWEEILVKAGVPCAPVNTIDKVFLDPAIQERGMVISVDHFGEELRLFGNPIRMSETPIVEYRTPPRLGADNREVFVNLLGYSPEKVEEFKERGII
jgi:crotonobetainyl-CoA:carnitine CoA-transferase CaiB-like acyl-CoA transferase